MSNAGGVNLHACVAALHEAASEQGVELNVAVVTGDEFMDKVQYIYMSRKSDCLGCAVLLCLVCLFDLACFFLSSSLI